MIGLAFSLSILSLGFLLLFHRGKERDRDRLTGDTLPYITVTAIYCLDCAGDELLPLKTFLTSNGRCNKCFGRSYLLATACAPAIKRELQRQLRTRQARERTERIERRVNG